VAVSDAPRSIATTPDGSKAYVGSANGVVDVLDLATFTWSGSIVVGGPYQDSVNGLSVSPDGSRVFALWGNLVAIDTATDTVVASIYAGNTPTSMALSPDGRFAYVASAFGYGPFVFAGALATVDLRSQTVVNSVNRDLARRRDGVRREPVDVREFGVCAGLPAEHVGHARGSREPLAGRRLQRRQDGG
jgi:YVTN family beta-propeller protein